MIQKDLILKELQNTIHGTDNEQVKVILGNVVADILSGRFDIQVW